MSSVAERPSPGVETRTSRKRAAGEAELYQSPVHGVFITRDGEIRQGVAPGQSALSSASLATVLAQRPGERHRFHVAGVPLHALSGTGNRDLGAALGLSEDYAQALKMAGQAISTASVVGTAISLAITALEWLGVFGEGENPFEELFTRISNQLNYIYVSDVAGQKLDTMQKLSGHLSEARAAASAVTAYHLDPTPLREDELKQAYHGSRVAVHALEEDSMWLRVYDPGASPIGLGGSPGWTLGPAVRPDLLMWDWRLPLLAYVVALAARIAVIRTLDPAVDKAHRAEILGYAASLQAIEARIRLGGFSRSIPSADAGWNFWEVMTRDNCGVIDVQSGESDVAWSWSPGTWFKDPWDANYHQAHGQPRDYADYREWHERGVELRYWRLYDRLGLFALWTSISDIQSAAEGMPGVGQIAVLQKHYDLDAFSQVDPRSRVRMEAFASWSADRAVRRVTLAPERPPA
jgi:hypothetical protein